ncbi:MAG: hypothetical protein M0039_06515 [Pseudomonadota bacterium]|nr:hypothetical protein [Pseudomonadota bacterium]
MPIIEQDSWRTQYFEGVDCPDDIVIPTDDEYAYRLYPHFRWIYNKLLICETQNLEHAPHGVAPQRFPVFSKPVYNLRGMGVGSRVIASREEYEHVQQPGHMWMPLLDGEHVSSDVALVDGEPVWWRHVLGQALGDGVFDYWTVLAERRPGIELYCGNWLRRHLPGYSGCVNLETIGGTIIEAHLRFADQWPDLYGNGWIEAVVSLYAQGVWSFAGRGCRTGYSVVLSGPPGLTLPRFDRGAVPGLLAGPEISSIQITFDEGRLAAGHAMPPGGPRLAVVNCWDLGAGFAVRERLAEMMALPPSTRKGTPLCAPGADADRGRVPGSAVSGRD